MEGPFREGRPFSFQRKRRKSDRLPRSPGCSRSDYFTVYNCCTPPCISRWCCRRWSPAGFWGFGRQGVFGRFFEQVFGLVFSFRWTGAALAAAVMGFPLMVRAIRLSIEAVDAKLEQAASTLGAPAWFVFGTITLPLAAPGILAGLILGFARAIGEFGATITFVANIPG